MKTMIIAMENVIILSTNLNTFSWIYTVLNETIQFLFLNNAAEIRFHFSLLWQKPGIQ